MPIGKVAAVLVALAVLATCGHVAGPPPVILETIPAPEFGTNAPDCWKFYNNEQHQQWADCIGVGYISD